MRWHLHCPILACILLIITYTATAIEGDTLWTRTYGGAQYDAANSILSTYDSGFLLAGGSEVSEDNVDMYLVRGNADGDTLWTHTYGESFTEFAYSLISASNGGYLLAGVSDYDAYLVRITDLGDTIWTRTYAGAGFINDLACLQVDANAYLIAGATATFDSGYSDIYLLKINEQGDTLWTRTYGKGYYDWPHDIIPSGEGSFLLVGETGSFGFTDFDVYVIMINTEGDTLWSRTYGGTGIEEALSVVATNDGGFLIAGCANYSGTSGVDIYLIKINADGDSIWARTYGGSSSEVAYDIIATDSGDFLIAGCTNSFGAGFEDMYLVKINSQGDTLWTRTYGGALIDLAFSIADCDDGGFLLAGSTGFYPATNMWLVKIAGSDTTAIEPAFSQNPSSFALHPCHPNPFNPTTTISYELQAASHVSLKIYDTAGRLVAMLVEDIETAGTHTATFDGSSFPSGLYLYRLTAGQNTATGKMVLLK